MLFDKVQFNKAGDVFGKFAYHKVGDVFGKFVMANDPTRSIEHISLAGVGSAGASRQTLGQLQNLMHQMRLGASQAGGDLFAATSTGLDRLQQTSKQLASYGGNDLAQQVTQLQRQVQQLQQKLQMLSGGGATSVLARFL